MGQSVFDLVNYEQAKALEALGFPQRPILDKSFDVCYCTQYSEGKDSGIILNIGDLTTYNTCNYLSADSIEAPSLELAAKWLRDEKNIYFVTEPHFLEGRIDYSLTIVSYIDNKYSKIDCYFDDYYTPKSLHSYEEAISAGIDKAIEILKNN